MVIILIVIAMVMTRQLSIKLREIAARRALRACHEMELAAYLLRIEKKKQAEIAASEAILAETEWVDSMVRQSFRP